MEPGENNKTDKNTKTKQSKTDSWIEKAEELIDETAEKIHKSDTYKKADQSMEKATKKLFRQAGKWWGKSERYFKDSGKKKDKE